MDVPSAFRTRRSVLTAAAAAGGALAAQAVAGPSPVAAADIVLGAINTAGAATTIRSNEAVNTAKALVGVVLYGGGGGSTAGVQGQSNALHGNGVFGVAMAGNSKGVWGRSANGRGVYGEATGTTGKNYGVYGESKSTDGRGVYGVGRYGVHGQATGAGGVNYGVYGQSESTGGAGVGGVGNIGVYGVGNEHGVVGLSNGDSSAIYGANGSGIGIWGHSNQDIGVRGTGATYGVYGSNGTIGVRGQGSSYGAYFTGTSYGVFASSSSYAGWFNGKVRVTGAFENPGGSFLIDHPMDPGNRTLAHASVDAPERLNVYRGNVTLDSRGRATIRMPRYVRALNSDYSYQLTPMGQAAPGLHVARAIEGGSFVVGGGQAGQVVCWQVTGVRQDAWAKTNPLRVERAKRRKDRGKYLNPEVHGMPRSAAINPPLRDVRPVRRRRGRGGDQPPEG